MLIERLRGFPARSLVGAGVVGGLLTGALLLAPGAASVSAPTVPSVAAPKPSAPATVTFSGAGWGHGVGLSQYGALGMARQGYTATQIVQHYYTGTTVSAVRDDAEIKVNLLHNTATAAFRSQALVTGGGGIQVQLTHQAPVVAGPLDTFVVGRAAGLLTLTRISSTGVRTLLGSAIGITVSWAGTRVPGGAGTLPTVLNLNSSIPSLSGSGHRYRYGAVTFVPTNGSTTLFEVVNTLRIHDEYLLGIAEVPSSWPQAALQAQVIAARSYALSKMSAIRPACRCNVDDGGGPYYDQTFAGYSKESGTDGSQWQRAVQATDASATTGAAVLYAGQPISAFYTSSTGGRTQSSKDVWGGALPWAVSVDDHWSLDPSVTPWAVWNPRPRSQAQLAGVFGLPNVVSLDLSHRLVSGALATATATSSTGKKVTVGGYTFAHGMGLPSLWMWRAQTSLVANPITAAAAAAPTGTSAVLAPSAGLATVDAALAASFASARSLPYFLTPGAALAPATRAALIARKVTTVYLIGTFAEIPAGLVREVQALKIKIVRIAGSNSTSLSIAVARQLGAPAGTPMLVGSAAQANTVVATAAVAGILRRPLIVLPAGNALPPSAVRTFVATLKPTSTLVVGPATAVSDPAGLLFPQARRVTGVDQADVSARLAALVSPAARTRIGLASLTGSNASALVVAASRAPLLWTGPALPASGVSLLQGMSTSTIQVVGVVPSGVVWAARRA